MQVILVIIPAVTVILIFLIVMNLLTVLLGRGRPVTAGSECRQTVTRPARPPGGHNTDSVLGASSGGQKLGGFLGRGRSVNVRGGVKVMEAVKDFLLLANSSRVNTEEE